MKTETIAGLLEAVELALRGLSEDPELQKKMNAYGFMPKRVQEGRALLEHAKLLINTQEQHYTHARQLAHQIKQDSQATRQLFSEHVAIAKVAFRQQPLVIQELKVKKISQQRWGWAQQALAFYQHAPAYLEKLQQYGVTPEAFQQNQAAVQALLDLKAQRIKKKGKAENSTQEKNLRIKELRAWYGEFRKLARMAFQDSPQLLETFGIIVPSGTQKRKLATVPVA